LYFNKTIQIGISINDFKTQFVGYSNKGNIYNEKAKLKNNKYGHLTCGLLVLRK
jgi:hypothetical protein